MSNDNSKTEISTMALVVLTFVLIAAVGIATAMALTAYRYKIHIEQLHEQQHEEQHEQQQ